jgi:small subunit ribosomal protein S14
MSKLSKTSREDRIIRLRNDEALANREALNKILDDPKASTKDKQNASIRLQKRRVNESLSRTNRRCQKCKRPKGVLRFFGLCRLCVREFADKGLLPGLRKSSW